MKFLGILILVVLAGFGGSVRAEVRFFDSLYDVPVMPGLYEVPEMALIFDNPGGRIAQAGAALGELAEADVAAFYAQALPQLGWQKRAVGAYAREDETLRI